MDKKLKTDIDIQSENAEEKSTKINDESYKATMEEKYKRKVPKGKK